jgi:cytochrome c5
MMLGWLRQRFGAPKLGDAKAWKPLIAEGQAALSRTAIKGIRKMPPKGGRPDLSDLEVRRAVVYMANAGGAKWSEPSK